MKNKNKSVLFTLLLVMASYISHASDGVEMADTMRSEGKIYVVVAVMAIVFTGIAIYLFTLDKKLGRIEKELKEKQSK